MDSDIKNDAREEKTETLEVSRYKNHNDKVKYNEQAAVRKKLKRKTNNGYKNAKFNAYVYPKYSTQS